MLVLSALVKTFLVSKPLVSRCVSASASVLSEMRCLPERPPERSQCEGDGEPENSSSISKIDKLQTLAMSARAGRCFGSRQTRDSKLKYDLLRGCERGLCTRLFVAGVARPAAVS